MFESITQTAQRTIEQGETVKIVLIIYFVLVLIACLLLISSKFSDYINWLKFSTFKKTKKHGHHKIRGFIEDQSKKPVAYLKVTLSDSSEKIVSHTFTSRNGEFDFFVEPGKYFLSADRFGFQSALSKEIEIKNSSSETDLTLETKEIEDIRVNFGVLKFMIANNFIWLILALAGILLSYCASIFWGTSVTIEASLCLIATLVIFISCKKSGLTLTSTNNKKMSREVIQFYNSKGDPLAQTKTNRQGKIYMLASPGFYKMVSKSKKERTFKVSENGLVDLKLQI
ncbi:MAG: carboxypeptidase-like regulatory domain-containing protein [Candidatus Berkelbacteria bacterium]|nr:carboxypeptidase-like regulatory domain-containing protein [Candidatus Berkelbacteria bacterium]